MADSRLEGHDSVGVSARFSGQISFLKLSGEKIPDWMGKAVLPPRGFKSSSFTADCLKYAGGYLCG